MNVVMTGDGRLVEVQATAEAAPFSRDALDELLDLAPPGSRRRASRTAQAGGDRCRLSSPSSALGELIAPHRRSRPPSAARSALERELRERGGRPANAPARLGRLLRSSRSSASTGSAASTFGSQNGIVVRPDPHRRPRSSPASASSAPARSSGTASPCAGLTTAATLWIAGRDRPGRRRRLLQRCESSRPAPCSIALVAAALRRAQDSCGLRPRGGGAADRRAATPGESGSRMLDDPVERRVGARPSALEFAEEAGGGGSPSTLALPGSLTPTEVCRRAHAASSEILGARVGELRARLASGNAHKLDELRAALPAGRSTCSPPTGTRPRTARRTPTTRARRPRSAGRSCEGGRGCSARTRGSRSTARRRPGRPLGALRRRRRRWRLLEALAASRASGGARATSASSSRSARGARSSAAGAARGPDRRRRRRGSEGFGYDPIFVPPANSARSPSSATPGSSRTRTAPARPGARRRLDQR